MRQARFMHGCLLCILTASLAAAGCTHNYYYGAVPQCAPGLPGTVQYGSVCDVPAASGGTAVAKEGTRPSVVGSAPRVVVSEPSGPRLSWRRSDPDAGVPTTRVSGAMEDDSTKTR